MIKYAVFYLSLLSKENLKQIANYEKCINYRLHRSDRFGTNHEIEKYLESGPSAIVDITNEQQIAETVSKYNIDTIYNLAALLSAVAEAKPQLAWKIGMGGLFNVLEVAREMGCAVFTPSSIGVFGNNTPKDKTPQDTIRNPRTMYGVTKVSGELLSDYYHIRFGVDTRSVRFPGLISYVTPPGGGTTDYAVDIYYSAVKGEKFECPIAAGTFMDMMYMPDGLRAAIEIMEANPDKLIHRNSFNIASMSFDPEIIYNNIKKYARLPYGVQSRSTTSSYRRIMAELTGRHLCP